MRIQRLQSFIFLNIAAASFFSSFFELYPNPAYTVQGETPDSKEKSAPQKTSSHSVTVELGDGRTLSGTVRIQSPDKIVVKHTKNEISYTKEVALADFSEIEFLKWKGSHLRKSKEGEVYRFDAVSISLKLSDGKTFVIEKDLFPFLEKLVIENSNGQVALFSFWIDLLHTDGTWYTGMSGPVSGNRILCHKDVIKRITFRKDE